MPDCVPFRLYVGENVAAVVAVLLDEMQRRGLPVSGNSESGTFAVPLPVGASIAGSFAVSGKSRVVTVTSRPEAVSCGQIESRMQDFVLDAKAMLRNRREA